MVPGVVPIVVLAITQFRMERRFSIGEPPASLANQIQSHKWVVPIQKGLVVFSSNPILGGKLIILVASESIRYKLDINLTIRTDHPILVANHRIPSGKLA